MLELMWDDQAGFFFDYDVRDKRMNPHPSLAGFYPLWAGLATPEQAERRQSPPGQPNKRFEPYCRVKPGRVR